MKRCLLSAFGVVAFFMSMSNVSAGAITIENNTDFTLSVLAAEHPVVLVPDASQELKLPAHHRMIVIARGKYLVCGIYRRGSVETVARLISALKNKGCQVIYEAGQLRLKEMSAMEEPD